MQQLNSKNSQLMVDVNHLTESTSFFLILIRLDLSLLAI